MTRIALVTGGKGFLGAHLAARLSSDGWNVHITSRSPGADSAGINCHVCDLADLHSARRLLDEVRPEIVFHLAGAASARPDLRLVLPTLHSHVTSAVNLMTLIEELPVQRLVISGSLMETLQQTPSSPYSAAKGVARLYAQMFHFLYGSPVVVVRPFMTFGPGQSAEKVLPYAIRSFAAREQPKLSSGDWRADWIFVTDVVEGFLRAATAVGVEGKALDLGRGELKSLKEMVLRIAELMAAEVLPAFGAQPDRPQEPERIADVRLTEELLGWTPAVSLDDGLRRTIDAYRT